MRKSILSTLMYPLIPFLKVLLMLLVFQRIEKWEKHCTVEHQLIVTNNSIDLQWHLYLPWPPSSSHTAAEVLKPDWDQNVTPTSCLPPPPSPSTISWSLQRSRWPAITQTPPLPILFPLACSLPMPGLSVSIGQRHKESLPPKWHTKIRRTQSVGWAWIAWRAPFCASRKMAAYGDQSDTPNALSKITLVSYSIKMWQDDK